jgi:signal transduction histidine kinase
MIQSRDSAARHLIQDRELFSQEKESHRKTKTALNTREEFLAIVSHDLRNPLNNIFMAAQNLLEETGEAPEVKAIASSINRSAGEMLRLIQDLLDIERIAIGKLILHYEKHDISEIIKDVVRDFQRNAAAKEVTLTVTQKAGCDEIICDRRRVVQSWAVLQCNQVPR